MADQAQAVAKFDENGAQKTRAKQAKNDFDLHTALLMRFYKLGKSEAQALAYVEGLLGLDDRLPKGSTR